MDFNDPAFDFSAMAAGMGVKAQRVDKVAELGPIFKSAFAEEGPNLIDVQISSGYE
jgi:thiamine pyrophosphate-dependent acetolactate synthase large subunit-like protein